MAIVGVAATVVAGIVAAIAAFLGIRSWPDINRYRRIRKM